MFITQQARRFIKLYKTFMRFWQKTLPDAVENLTYVVVLVSAIISSSFAADAFNPLINLLSSTLIQSNLCRVLWNPAVIPSVLQLQHSAKTN